MARIREPRLLLAVVCLLAMVGYSVGDQAVGLEFALEIDGKEVSAKELDGVQIDDIEIEPIAMMPTAAGEDVVYCPGTAKYGNVAIRALPGSGLALALYQWWLDCSQGKNIRKNMSVIAKNKDRAEARRFNLFDTWPVRWEAADLSGDSTDCATLVCSIGRVELGLSDDTTAVPDEAYRIVITGGGEKEGASDGGWREKEGGAQQLVELPGVTCEEPQGLVSAQVGELLLKGPLTAGRRAMCSWITAAAAPDDAGDDAIKALDDEILAKEGKLKEAAKKKRLLDEAASKRTVTLRANLPGDSSTYAYHECIPTRYSFPSFSASDPGVLYEEITIKPIRLELAA